MSEQFKELHKLVIVLCDQFEQMWLERQALRLVISESQIPEWKAQVAQAQTDPILRDQARDACKSMRGSLLDQTAWAYLESPESTPPTSSVQ
jgi:hypothetical protein